MKKDYNIENILSMDYMNGKLDKIEEKYLLEDEKDFEKLTEEEMIQNIAILLITKEIWEMFKFIPTQINKIKPFLNKINSNKYIYNEFVIKEFQDAIDIYNEYILDENELKKFEAQLNDEDMLKNHNEIKKTKKIINFMDIISLLEYDEKDFSLNTKNPLLLNILMNIFINKKDILENL